MSYIKKRLKGREKNVFPVSSGKFASVKLYVKCQKLRVRTRNCRKQKHEKAINIKKKVHKKHIEDRGKSLSIIARIDFGLTPKNSEKADTEVTEKL